MKSNSRSSKALLEEGVDEYKFMKRCDRFTAQLVKSEKKSRNSRQRRGGYSRNSFVDMVAIPQSSASVGSDKLHHGVLMNPTASNTPENSMQKRPCQQTKKAVEIERLQTLPTQPCPHPPAPLLITTEDENISPLALPAATPDHSPDPLATNRVPRATATGSRLDKYEVRDQIGKGSSSVVFHVTYAVDHSDYALKIIRLSDNPRDKVLKEVTILAKLEHPNIVRYYNSWKERAPDVWRDNRLWSSTLPATIAKPTTSSCTHTTTPVVSSADLCQGTFGLTCHTADSVVSFRDGADSAGPQASQSLLISETSADSNAECPKIQPALPIDPPTCLFIQTELCQRDTLRTWLNRNCEEKSRTMSEVLSFFKQILEALVYIHKEGFVHRDLKPSNIFFSRSGPGCIKIGEFGITKTAAIPHAADGYSQGSMQSEVALYRSPEQVEGKTSDDKSDMYALGIIFFELYYIMEARHQVLTDLRKLEFPAQFEKNLISVTRIVKLLLTTDPAERLTADKLTVNKSLRNLTKTAKKSREEYIPVW